MTENFRYLVIEGPIGVGKTSLAKKLAAEFGSELLLEQAQENPFLANFYHNPRQYALSAQLHFLLQRAQQVQDFRQSDLFRGSYIADFMVDKDRLFAQMTLNPRIVRRGIDYEQQIRDEYLLRLSESYTRFFYDYDDSALLTVNTQSVDLINNAEDYQAILEKINDIHSGRHYFNQSSFAL
jgi:deoxyadenosine/deoxycytidine kinase